MDIEIVRASRRAGCMARAAAFSRTHLTTGIHQGDAVGDTLEDGVQLLRLRLRRAIQPGIFQRDGCLGGQPQEQRFVVVSEAPRLRMAQQQPATNGASTIEQRGAKKAPHDGVPIRNTQGTQIIGRHWLCGWADATAPTMTWGTASSVPRVAASALTSALTSLPCTGISSASASSTRTETP